MTFWFDQYVGWWGCSGISLRMVFLWAPLIVGIVALIRLSIDDGNRPRSSTPSPERVLNDRFVRGEVTQTEYRYLLALLRDNPQH